MLEQLKRIKLAEIEEKIAQLEQDEEQYKKYNWFERNIFKKKEYETYRKEQSRKKREQLEELETQKNQYLNAKCIQQLGYDLQSAIETLHQRGIPEIITESEMKETTYRPTKPYVDSMEGIILVHKTNYVPTDAKIKSVKDAKVYENVEYQIAGHIIPMRIQAGRDTVHFAANGEVQEHLEGSAWSLCKYAVLVPFQDIPREQYANVFPNDTYTNGSVNLTTNCWILVPKGEGEEVRKNNPGVNVIEYEGPTVTGYADKVVRMLGYSKQEIDPGAYGGWRDADANNSFYEFTSREGFRSGIHYFSNEQYQERFSRAIQIIIQFIKYVEVHPETLNNPQFVKELQENIESQIVYTNGTPQNLCNDVYNHLINEGYELPQDIIAELSNLEEKNHLGVQYRLAEEIMKMIHDNNLTKNKSQGIKK